MDQLKFDKIEMVKVQRALESEPYHAKTAQRTLTLDAERRSGQGIALPGSAP